MAVEEATAAVSGRRTGAGHQVGGAAARLLQPFATMDRLGRALLWQFGATALLVR